MYETVVEYDALASLNGNSNESVIDHLAVLEPRRDEIGPSQS
jgi:hypothetical protein